MSVRRIYVEKKKGFNIEAQGLLEDLTINLGITGLQDLRIINRYDIAGMLEEEYQQARDIVFCEPPVDVLYEECMQFDPGNFVFAIEYLPGQYDQRADSAAQCVQIITRKERPAIRVAKLIVLEGNISGEDYQIIKNYCINPVEAREASLEKPETIEVTYASPDDIAVLDGFIGLGRQELDQLSAKLGFAMTLEDILFCQAYFRDEEKRDPSMTEIRVIDTYWSDHCRHTTFLTAIEEVDFAPGPFSELLKGTYTRYKEMREQVYGHQEKKECLMDIATIAMKLLRKQGRLNDLDESDEINACSIVVKVDVDDQQQEWLVMFKNETHNHPTEIEPFGGAATCLGGAIRDPLSGRAYVYQAMRVTGSGDPRTRFEDTLSGKLPQRKITTGAAMGYSSYGNQIGLATGQVTEIYHEGYTAKRMEIGAVIGAAPKENVVRANPTPGDIIILLGGQTGRDGCGGATGSSKAHTEDSLASCGAEVQKGNPPTERKIQRLFRQAEVTTLIKKCNDFGAGGVCVAIGELAPGLFINLDAVPKKYEGLDGTELAISESQERMAVVVDPSHVDTFIEAARKENLEATPVARVTDNKRLQMKWRGSLIVDISRSFLDTNGAEQKTKVFVQAPSKDKSYFNESIDAISDVRRTWLSNLKDLNVCSQRGLVERFDSTIGAGTVLMPFGGKHQITPAEGMAAKIPVLRGETNTATIMTFGYNPQISSWSPFHGAVYAVVEAIAKITAMGGDYRTARLTLQEYFERLGDAPEKWGQPFSALLGALYVQERLGIPAIGGKDSMSGTFKDRTVPPTLTAFAVCTADARTIISPEFKNNNSQIVLISILQDDNQLPDFTNLENSYSAIYHLIQNGKVCSAHTVRSGGIAEALSKMALGNGIGIKLCPADERTLFQPAYGSIILEIPAGENIDTLLEGLHYKLIGYTQAEGTIKAGGATISLEDILASWEEPLETIFPIETEHKGEILETYNYSTRNHTKPLLRVASPRVFIPVFPGTNCEYDTARAFEKAGAVADIMIIRNLTSGEIDETIKEMAKRISQSQILMLPGGFSGGDEPDGSGKFIAAALKNPRVRDSVMNLIRDKDGLILGICNGFQALIKVGLLPYGEIMDMGTDSPTLTFNTIGRHMSRMVQTRISSVLSPWLSHVQVGDIHTVPVSHGEGRFVATPEVLQCLVENGQIATQYVDDDGNPNNNILYNPNGSLQAIEGITSPDGRVFGKMAHSERLGSNVAKNIPGNKDQKIFASGVAYYQ